MHNNMYKRVLSTFWYSHPYLLVKFFFIPRYAIDPFVMIEISTSALFQLSLLVHIKSSIDCVTSNPLEHETTSQAIEPRQTKLISIDATINFSRVIILICSMWDEEVKRAKNVYQTFFWLTIPTLLI